MFLFFYGIGVGFENFWYRQKYRYRFRNFLLSKKYRYWFQKKLYLKKYRYWYQKKIGIEKSIGISIEKNWYRKKVLDSASFRFWVLSHTEMQNL